MIMKIRKRRDLEIALQGLADFPEPKAYLEQYMTPARIAADILFTAFGRGDIEGMRVADLGCGTGIFAIGAGLLGAASVSGFDKDGDALRAAGKNAALAGVIIEFVETDVSEVTGSYDTVLMNPPFGAQNRHADRPFLKKAFEIAPVVWSVHNAGTEDFVEKMAASFCYGIDRTNRYKFEVRHTYPHHTRERVNQDVVVLRLVDGGNEVDR